MNSSWIFIKKFQTSICDRKPFIYSNIYVGGIYKFITPIYNDVIDTKNIIFGQITLKLVKTNDLDIHFSYY